MHEIAALARIPPCPQNQSFATADEMPFRWTATRDVRWWIAEDGCMDAQDEDRGGGCVYWDVDLFNGEFCFCFWSYMHGYLYIEEVMEKVELMEVI